MSLMQWLSKECQRPLTMNTAEGLASGKQWKEVWNAAYAPIVFISQTQMNTKHKWKTYHDIQKATFK